MSTSIDSAAKLAHVLSKASATIWGAERNLDRLPDGSPMWNHWNGRLCGLYTLLQCCGALPVGPFGRSAQELQGLLKAARPQLPGGFESYPVIEAQQWLMEQGIQASADEVPHLQRHLVAGLIKQKDVVEPATGDVHHKPLAIGADFQNLARPHHGRVVGALEVTVPYTLHFTEWECGHHQQRPADIQVSSMEQAAQILVAISHSISQPGHAHGVLMDETHATPIYLTDDYFSVGHGAAGVMSKSPFSSHGSERPTLFYGTEAEITQLESEAHAHAAEWVYGGALARWDGKSFFDDSVAMTTLSLAELEALVDPDRLPKTRGLFDLPPIFRPASAALQELQAEIDETNGVEPPYELPHPLECKTLLPAQGTLPITIEYSATGYQAKVREEHDVFGAYELEAFSVYRFYTGTATHFHIGLAKSFVHGRLYSSENIYMVPDCYGNLTEVPRW